jgi:hypothetical protein
VEFVHRDCDAAAAVEVRCAAGHVLDEPRKIAPRPGPGIRPA